MRPIAALGLLSAATVGVILFLPIPCRVATPLVLQPSDAQRVYVVTPGTLVEAAPEGSRIDEGGVIALLENRELQDERLRIEGELQRAIARIAALEANLASDSDSAARLSVAREVAKDLAQQAELRKAEAELLTVLSPARGEIIRPDIIPPQAENETLDAWSGTPLAPENLGAQLERGTLLCLVGDPGRCEGLLYVDEADIALVSVGQEVGLRLDAERTRVMRGRIVDLAEISAETSGTPYTAGQDAEGLGEASRRYAGRTAYQARVEITEPGGASLRYGALGEARIEAAPQTLLERALRWLSKTLTIEKTVNAAR